MKLPVLLIPASLLALAPLAIPVQAHEASARTSAKPSQAASRAASIPFADHGNVRNWRAQGTRAVYFEDNHRQWYRAELMGTAFDLPYVEHIGILSGPSGSLDKFGAITVRGQRYAFASFEKVAGPPSTKGATAKAGKAVSKAS